MDAAAPQVSAGRRLSKRSVLGRRDLLYFESGGLSSKSSFSSVTSAIRCGGADNDKSLSAKPVLRCRGADTEHASLGRWCSQGARLTEGVVSTELEAGAGSPVSCSCRAAVNDVTLACLAHLRLARDDLRFPKGEDELVESGSPTTAELAPDSTPLPMPVLDPLPLRLPTGDPLRDCGEWSLLAGPADERCVMDSPSGTQRISSSAPTLPSSSMRSCSSELAVPLKRGL